MEISTLVIESFKRELNTATGCGCPLDNDEVASGFVNGFCACFCIRTFGKIEDDQFNSLCALAYSALGIE